jgi:hypothetical protein
MRIEGIKMAVERGVDERRWKRMRGDDIWEESE